MQHKFFKVLFVLPLFQSLLHSKTTLGFCKLLLIPRHRYSFYTTIMSGVAFEKKLLKITFWTEKNTKCATYKINHAVRTSNSLN